MGMSDAKHPPSKWKRDGVDLQALEDKLRIEIDPAFFEPEEDFRPFNQVIEILSVSLDQDKDNETPDFEELAGNPLHRNIQRQLQVCSDVVERITVEHHGSLNSSVQAMGGVARHYNQTRANVGTLRGQLRECKQLLQTGSSQTDVRELWQRKLQYSLVLRLLGALDMIKDAPVKFERLVRQKRFVGAVDLLNESLLNIFSAELVDVPAVASVRDEMLAQKGKILDTLVEEIADVLFLRSATAQLSAADKARSAGKSRRRGERGGANGALLEDPMANALSRGQGTVGGGGAGISSDAASESSAGGGDAAGMMWAGIHVDVTDVGDNEEQALDDPSQEFSVYLRLLVEAVRRLRCLDDVERYLLERLPNEVLTLSATHMRTCVGKNEEVGVNVGAATFNSKSKNDGLSARGQNLTQYLSLMFDSFTSVLANLIRLVRLLHAARLRDLREQDPGAPVFEADAPFKESLVVGLWQHIQAHLIDVLTRHVSETQAAEVGSDATKGDATGVQSSRLGPAGVEPSLTSSSVPLFRPLRRPESSATGLASTGMELNHVSAAEYCRSRMLADPSPMIMISIFRPTLKFVEVEEAMINAMKKEVFESGHIHRERGGQRTLPEGSDNDGSSLTTFMHSTARERFLPLLGADCRTMNAQLMGDHDWCLPASMASGSQPNLSSADGSGISRERTPGALRPSRGAEDVYAQARTLFRAMVQLPHYAEEIGEILRTSLEEYFSLVQNKFQDITVNSASRWRLEQFSDKLRDLLRRDAQYSTYKTFVYGGLLRWEDSEVSDVLSLKGRNSLNSVPAKHVERLDIRRGRDGHVESSEHEEADDIFESEFTMLKDLWKFDSAPFPVTKQSLLSLRKQQSIACLAFSCDWLSHKLLKICVAIKHQHSDAHSSAAGSKLNSPSKILDFEGRTSSSAGGATATMQKLRQLGRKLSQLADDSLLCLRLEVYMLVSFYMQQLPSIDLEVTSGQGSTTAMSLGSVEDQCVVTLNRCIREEEEALSPFEPKGSMALLCPRELLAFVLAPLPRLLPRLFVLSFSFLKTNTITVGGVGKLNKILNTLQQTVGDVTEEQKSRNQEDAPAMADDPGSGTQGSTGLVGERFKWARQYVALISMSQSELESFIRKNRTKFSKEEYRVLWSLVGPNRRLDGGKKFDVVWAG
eukprot:g9766.t1